MNKILITGGAGFIGSNLCQFLLADKKNYIICLDNFSTGSKSNIEHLLSNKNFQLIESDVCKKLDLIYLPVQKVMITRANIFTKFKSFTIFICNCSATRYTKHLSLECS